MKTRGISITVVLINRVKKFCKLKVTFLTTVYCLLTTYFNGDLDARIRFIKI